MPKKKNWIAAAVPKSHKGRFTRKAKAHNKSVQTYANEVISSYKRGGRGKPTLKTYRQAVLARTFGRMRHKQS
tara:strand:- start:481 stop:699 length:219 start_codon:yes stop_codon:yes gene_type:complete